MAWAGNHIDDPIRYVFGLQDFGRLVKRVDRLAHGTAIMRSQLGLDPTRLKHANTNVIALNRLRGNWHLGLA